MPAPPAAPGSGTHTGPGANGLRRLTPLVLLKAARPRQALLTAAGLAAAGALSGRPVREVALVAVTVLTGQALLGWDGVLADDRNGRSDSASDHRPEPGAESRLDRGTLAFALACAVLLVVPLSLSSGMAAGLAYLLSVAVGVVGNRLLGQGAWSWLPWAIAFASYPAYLSYGGWGGDAHGHPPTTAITVAAALLGPGIHVLTSLRGLVEDNRAGRRHVPLRLALRVGAPRLLVLATVYCLVVIAAIALIGGTVGLSRT
jgi:hypothetical protein